MKKIWLITAIIVAMFTGTASADNDIGTLFKSMYNNTADVCYSAGTDNKITISQATAITYVIMRDNAISSGVNVDTAEAIARSTSAICTNAYACGSTESLQCLEKLKNVVNHTVDVMTSDDGNVQENNAKPDGLTEQF